MIDFDPNKGDTFDPVAETITSGGVTRPMTADEVYLLVTEPAQARLVSDQIVAAGAVTDSLIAQATAMRDGLVTWLGIPVSDRDPSTAAAMEAQGKSLALAAVGVPDSTVIALMGEITAMGTIARRERAEYEAGLLS